MTELKVGQRVAFQRASDKAVTLTGKIVKLSDGGLSADIQTEADGRIVEVSGVECASTGDVQVLAQESKGAPDADKEAKAKEASAAPPEEPAPSA